jgi:hypothetical protein
MRSQLYHLAEVAEHPKTTIQVIRSGGAHAGLLAHFVIADLDGKPSAVYQACAAQAAPAVVAIRPVRSHRQQRGQLPAGRRARQLINDFGPPLARSCGSFDVKSRA